MPRVQKAGTLAIANLRQLPPELCGIDRGWKLHSGTGRCD
jgi:hypothetical protein